MRPIYTDIINNESYINEAHQMRQAGFCTIAIQNAFFEEVEAEWNRSMDVEEIERGVDAFRTIAENSI